ncbi:type II toxin-antitoxin system HicB family antitoxin [Micromonospora sp. WMMD998]|uniref:type II toxin-antitoxin system HicB family antitoxin n=1 Tax=Micromonospora sp. WMMD998 TaxID=3016092 RepID=UPI00249A0ABC|nr:type II toxin-antitoxin system HicB family antitoxin [Micromonospora sp. WMMD998]WFE38108.1 type II toxin-antitoxin system HicB family antitoxin [Micromonospora sp. WMMD998]
MKYTATCVRSGGWWAITVPEITGVFSQARRLDQVEGMAREAIALLLEVDPLSFDVEVQPEMPQEVTRARKARSALRAAEESAEEATVTAVRALLSKGYTVRDAGALLGISAQRVSQLAPKRGAGGINKGGQDAAAA